MIEHELTENQLTQSHAPSGKVFWICAAAGWGIILFGLIGVLEEANRTNPAHFALWFVGSAIAHDALLAPAVFVTAVILGKVVPATVRPVVQMGLIVAGSVTIVSLPFVLGLGGQAGNSSALPRNYLGGLLIIQAIVAGVTVLAVLRKLRRRPGLRLPDEPGTPTT